MFNCAEVWKCVQYKQAIFSLLTGNRRGIKQASAIVSSVKCNYSSVLSAPVVCRNWEFTFTCLPNLPQLACCLQCIFIFGSSKYHIATHIFCIESNLPDNTVIVPPPLFVFLVSILSNGLIILMFKLTPWSNFQLSKT